jgi:hypothetical protein
MSFIAVALHTKIFVYRLFSFIYYNELSSVGYVADIVEVLGKYELYHYLEDYIKTGGVVKTLNAGISRNMPEYNGIWRNITEYAEISRLFP